MRQTKHRMTIHRDGKPTYDIRMELSFEELAGEMGRFDLAQRKLCIVTDSTMVPLYLDEVGGLLRPLCRTPIHVVILAGEEYKSLDTMKSMHEVLTLRRFGRRDILVALGGGVIGDLCGFTAVTYLRGVFLVQIPTTLPSQVDSSIGGKTRVDSDAYKNIVGAFYMLGLVYTNVGALRTLTKEQYSSGIGEITKHGLIKDQIYHGWLAEHRQEILALDMSACQEMIERNDEIKRLVMEEDPTEQGERAPLNSGHTLEYTVEKLKNLTMPYGHCVGLGCLSAAYTSARRDYISMEEVDTLKELMEAFGIPVSMPGLSVNEVMETTGDDKEMGDGVVKFILLEFVGYTVIDR